MDPKIPDAVSAASSSSEEFAALSGENKLVEELPQSSSSRQMREESGENKPGMEMWGTLPFLSGAASPMVGRTRMPGMMGVGLQMFRPPPNIMGGQSQGQMKQRSEIDDLKEIDALVNKKTIRETQKSKTGEELLDLIHGPTAKETAVAVKFKSKGGSQVKEYCLSLTKEDCRRKTGSYIACEKVHFHRIISAHTDASLGDCSFLDTCRHTKTCKYVHYELDQTTDMPPIIGAGCLPPPGPMKLQAKYCSEVELGEP